MSAEKVPPKIDSAITEKDINEIGEGGNEPAELSLSEEVLKMIEKRIYEERSLAEPLHSQFSNLWGKVTEKGLPQEEKKKLLDKYNMPDNCLLSDPPKVNPEIKAILDPQLHEAIYERDARIVLKQETLNTCLSVVSKILTTIIKEKKDKENLVISDCANDLLMLLADMNRDESRIRGSLLISKVSASLKPVLGENQCKVSIWSKTGRASKN